MRFRFQYRPYRLPFRAAVRTAHGFWAEREGIIVRLEAEGKTAGLGEAAPIPWFGTETVEEVEEVCRGLGEWVEDEALEAVPVRLGCLRNAIETARSEIPDLEMPDSGNRMPDSSESEIPLSGLSGIRYPQSGIGRALGVAALLPAGHAALTQIAPKAEIGFRVFKWKVGVGDIADELALFDDVCAALPSGAKMRLDANGAWDRRKAERWLERCAERPVEFVEQPCFADAAQGTTQQRKTEDVLLGLAADYPTPIGLDESLVGDGDVERWIAMGWSGIFVMKPSLTGDLQRAIGQLEKAKARVVFSSALETAIGARAALRVAFAWKGEGESPPRALGFGVWPLFADTRFDGPSVAPFVRREDVEKIDAEAVWNALS